MKGYIRESVRRWPAPSWWTIEDRAFWHSLPEKAKAALARHWIASLKDKRRVGKQA